MVEELGLDEDDLLERARNLYAAEISFADAWVGRLLNKLDDLGLDRDTTVLLLADHGMALGERGVIGKQASNAFSELYHVPYMIRTPKAAVPGRRAASSHRRTTSGRRCSLPPTCGCRAPWTART